MFPMLLLCPREKCKVLWGVYILSVSLSVCPLAYLENHTSKLHHIFYACWLHDCGRDSDSVAIRYVLPALWLTSYFHTVESTARCTLKYYVDSNRVLLNYKDRQLHIVGCTLGAKSALYNCLVDVLRMFQMTGGSHGVVQWPVVSVTSACLFVCGSGWLSVL